MELFLRVFILHSTSNGNPFAPHSNDTLSPICVETLISSLGLSNHGETRGGMKNIQLRRCSLNKENGDLHLGNILSKASSRLHILRVCTFYRLPLDHL